MNNRLVIPCLRGFMGTWTTYSCMMRLSDIAELVGFADELHNIEKLSDQIQRELNDVRAIEISDYLIQNKDRFFNSIVVAIYDGDPSWHDIGNLKPNSDEASQLEFPDYAEDCLGFLSITKEEKLFALDGQHRLAGIKIAIEECEEVCDDLMSVIIVAHSNTKEGKIRSRRLFTTLNKKAKLVSKDAIIALDEDDIAACITRELIESDDFNLFTEDNISFSSGPVRDRTSITSIVNIYDNIQKLVAHKLGVKVSELDKYKYRDHVGIYDFVKEFFALTLKSCKELSAVVELEKEAGKYRGGDKGGHLLFRPVGWDIYVDVIINALKAGNEDMGSIISNVMKNDLSLGGGLLSNKVWSTRQKRILKVSAKSFKSIEKALLHKK